MVRCDSLLLRRDTPFSSFPTADVAGCCRPLSSFVDWTGDVALPHCCHWGAQWVVAVVERLRGVVVVGSSEAVEGGGRSRWWWLRGKSVRICLFMMCMCISSKCP